MGLSRWGSPGGVLQVGFSRWSPLDGTLQMGFFKWDSPGGALQAGLRKVCGQASKGEWLEGLRKREKCGAGLGVATWLWETWEVYPGQPLSKRELLAVVCKVFSPPRKC